MRWLLLIALAACAHSAPRPVPTIVCGQVPDGDYCCVSVKGGRLIQLCGDDVKQLDEMKKKLDRGSV